MKKALVNKDIWDWFPHCCSEKCQTNKIPIFVFPVFNISLMYTFRPIKYFIDACFFIWRFHKEYFLFISSLFTFHYNLKFCFINFLICKKSKNIVIYETIIQLRRNIYNNIIWVSHDSEERFVSLETSVTNISIFKSFFLLLLFRNISE